MPFIKSWINVIDWFRTFSFISALFFHAVSVARKKTLLTISATASELIESIWKEFCFIGSRTAYLPSQRSMAELQRPRSSFQVVMSSEIEASENCEPFSRANTYKRVAWALEFAASRMHIYDDEEEFQIWASSDGFSIFWIISTRTHLISNLIKNQITVELAVEWFPKWQLGYSINKLKGVFLHFWVSISCCLRSCPLEILFSQNWSNTGSSVW